MQSRAGKTQNAAADWSAWASVPWSPVRRPETGATAGTNSGATPESADSPIGWLKSGVPYSPQGDGDGDADACALQTLDVWIPANNTTTTTNTPPNPAFLPPQTPTKTWLIYIHGGAWRDPAISSASFTPAATNLLQRAAATETATKTETSTDTSPETETASGGGASDGANSLAGLVSLNYRLSPHPSHPPASPADAVARGVRHPQHVADVRAALAFLGRVGVLGGGSGDGGAEREEEREGKGGKANAKWVLAGHSCGATLAFQAVMHPVRWGLGEVGGEGWDKPAALVGFNGLYDLAGFIDAPPEGYAHLRDGYREFVEGAFGADERAWRGACPATTEGKWVGEWIGAGAGDEAKGEKVVVLVQSREDTLVPWEQLEAMRARLGSEGQVGVKVMEATGNHDDVWREGGRMAEVLWNVLEEL